MTSRSIWKPRFHSKSINMWRVKIFGSGVPDRSSKKSRFRWTKIKVVTHQQCTVTIGGRGLYRDRADEGACKTGPIRTRRPWLRILNSYTGKVRQSWFKKEWEQVTKTQAWGQTCYWDDNNALCRYISGTSTLIFRVTPLPLLFSQPHLSLLSVVPQHQHRQHYLQPYSLMHSSACVWLEVRFNLNWWSISSAGMERFAPRVQARSIVVGRSVLEDTRRITDLVIDRWDRKRRVKSVYI